MIRSVLCGPRAGPQRRARQHRPARSGLGRAACAAAGAGVALTAAGLAGGAVPAVAATRPLASPVYTISLAGYQAHGQGFRFVSTTLTVPPRIVAAANSGDAVIDIRASCAGQCSPPAAHIIVSPGGGPGSVEYDGFYTGGQFRVIPQVGDRLTVSIYHDRRGHDYFTAADLTQHTTQTARLRAGGINPVYDWAEASVDVVGTVPSPAADTRLWKFTGTQLTTRAGVHGTILGPWQTRKLIRTTDGTSAGPVVASPAGPWNGGRDFGIWLRRH